MAEGNAVEKMQEQFPHVRKIIYTSHKSLRRVETALAANAYGYLLRNEETTIARVVECINIVYEGGTHFCSLCTPLVQPRLRGEKVEMFNNTEKKIIPLMAFGKTSAEIGKLLYKSPLTIEGYRKNMLKKTNTNNSSEFISWCYENEYLDK
jgi:DNA-binding NarL/FixJ family response regulator